MVVAHEEAEAASAAVLGRAVEFLVARGRRLEVLRRSTDHQRLRRDQPLQLRGQPRQPRGRMSVAEMLEAEIVQRCSREIGRASAQVVHHVLRRCPALGREAALASVQDKGSVRERAMRIVPALGLELRTALEPGQGLRTVRVPRSFRRIAFRDSVLPQARERWEVRACRTAWRIGRTRWRTADPTSAIACQTAVKIGNRIVATAKTIVRIGETTIAKTGRTGRMVSTTITAAGITAVGNREPAGATCGTTTRLRPRSV